MKKRFLLLTALLFVAIHLGAQVLPAVTRVGYVNSETIFNSLPEYKSAVQSLEALNRDYSAKVEAEFSKIETLYNSYQQRKNSLSAAERQSRENEIITKERAAKELQQSYFGEDGVMAKKSNELLGPIREKVKSAIERVAKNYNYMILLDVAAMQGVIYTNESVDLSTIVIKELKVAK